MVDKTSLEKCLDCGNRILPSAMANCSPFYCNKCGRVYSMEKMYAK